MLFLIEFEIKNILTIVPLKAILNLMSLLILFMTTFELENTVLLDLNMPVMDGFKY
jgi:CheY-like chemotaxis protein